MKYQLASLVVLASISVTSALATATATSFQLKYFDIKGVAETSRILFAIGQEKYDDARYKIDPATFKSTEFLAAKEAGDLKMNLYRAPVLVTPEGATIGQSKAIERYLARRFKLMGKTPEDEAVIDCIAEHCRDVKDAARQKGFSMFTRNKTDEEKAEARKEWFETDMPEMLGKIEQAVKETGSSGYAFGATMSYADVTIWALLRDCLAADSEDTAKASASCSALNAISENVAADPGVAKWLSERPESMF
jgi:glutathione S-transferase